MTAILNGVSLDFSSIGFGVSGQVLESLGPGVQPIWADTVVTLSKGAITATGNVTATALTLQNTWYQVTIFDTNKLSRGIFTADQANDRITIASGFNNTVEFEWVGSFICSTNLQVIEIGISSDGGSTIETPVLQRKVGTGSDVGSASMQTIASVDASGGAKHITLWARNTTSAGTTITLKEFYMEARDA